jgi:hypothetical protein
LSLGKAVASPEYLVPSETSAAVVLSNVKVGTMAPARPRSLTSFGMTRLFSFRRDNQI